MRNLNKNIRTVAGVLKYNIDDTTIGNANVLGVSVRKRQAGVTNERTLDGAGSALANDVTINAAYLVIKDDQNVDYLRLSFIDILRFQDQNEKGFYPLNGHKLDFQAGHVSIEIPSGVTVIANEVVELNFYYYNSCDVQQ